MTRDAAGVAFACADQDRLHLRFEDLEVQGRFRRSRRGRGGCRCRAGADPCRKRLPFRIVLRLPMLASAMPMTAAGSGGQRVDEQNALEWVTWDDEARYPLEVSARLLFGVARGSWRQRFQV